MFRLMKRMQLNHVMRVKFSLPKINYNSEAMWQSRIIRVQNFYEAKYQLREQLKLRPALLLELLKKELIQLQHVPLV